MYFDRYDLDESGTLNDADELRYLTMAVVKANILKLTKSEVLPASLQALSDDALVDGSIDRTRNGPHRVRGGLYPRRVHVLVL